MTVHFGVKTLGLRCYLLAAIAGCVAVLPAAGALDARPLPNAKRCAVFPADNPWNTDVSAYPVHANSANYIANILANGGDFLHDFFHLNVQYLNQLARLGSSYSIVGARALERIYEWAQPPDEVDPPESR